MVAKVWLAVGHGLKDSGVWDPGAVNAGVQLSEQSAGDVVVWEAARILTARGVTVRHEARDPNDPNWVGTVRMANAWGADLCISVHHDWSGSRLGAHGFYHGSSSDGEQVGRAILQAVQAAGFPVSWDWFRARDELGLLRSTRMPAFLLECGPIGAKVLDEPHELRRMGAALADGISAHLDIAVGGVTPPEPEDIVATLDELRTVVREELAAVPRDVWTFPLPHANVDGKRAAWQYLSRKLAGIRAAVAGIDVTADVSAAEVAAAVTADLEAVLSPLPKATADEVRAAIRQAMS